MVVKGGSVLQRFFSFILVLLFGVSGGSVVSGADVTAESLLARDKGVDSLTSWTLNIRVDEDYGDYATWTDYIFEQSDAGTHLVTRPEIAVADGDYDKFYIKATNTLFSTGVGGWFAMDNTPFETRFDSLMFTPVADMIFYPELEETADSYIVYGTAGHKVIDKMTWPMLIPEIAHSVNQEAKFTYDKETLELTTMHFEATNGDRFVTIEISISEVNNTVVELPFDPSTVRHVS